MSTGEKCRAQASTKKEENKDNRRDDWSGALLTG